MKKRNYFVIILFLVCSISVQSQIRKELLLDKGWKFSRTESPDFMNVAFNDTNWENVAIPHDWAIYGPFNKNNDIHRMAIVQDGQTSAIEHYGRTGGLPFTGKGFYRKTFDIPGYSQDKKVVIQFDGAMSNAHVYINGKKVGHWPNGYNTFYFDITNYINNNGKNNVVAVALENLEEQSRWYPGAGLYRNVHVLVTNKAHIPVWGTYLTTPEVNEKFAKINLKTKVNYPENTYEENLFELRTSIINPQGVVVAKNATELSRFNDEFDQNLIVENPSLWGIKQPNLYKAVSELYVIQKEINKEDNTTRTIKSARKVDEYETTFGIRSIQIIANDGFYLNGEKIKFQGACLHHDLGPLGAAVNEAAIRRQIKTMQDMGVNAIRTSHNMPAPEYVRIADEMGMMLMIETFDEWAIPKVKNGYNRYFEEWAEKDLVNVIHHYRNNPSVVMWCIGNEVEEQSHPQGAKVARFLQDIAHREDPTRPVTNGMDRPDHIFSNYMGAIMEVPGFNYRPFRYQEAYKKLPQQIILGSETASTLSSRGVYKFPVERKAMAKYEDHQASSYDVEHASWSNLPEDDFIQHEDLPYTIGEFIWTGIDYLGEPTPYYSNWPSHSSLFGAVDLAGIPKDRFYLYRSHWNKEEETLHILPHWNWEGREGEITPIFVYTSYPSAELFINGKSQGKRTKDFDVPLEGTYTAEAQKSLERQKRYRLMWMDTKYEPGTVKVVAYDEGGRAMAEKEIKTAGKPYQIVLKPDRKTISADGKDISFVNVSIVDENGNYCPTENREISFKVKGDGKFKAIANGNPASLESFQKPKMKLFNGQLTVLIQSSEKPGNIILEAYAKGIKRGTIKISSVK